MRSRGRWKATFEPAPPDAVHRKMFGRWTETVDWEKRRPDAAVAWSATIPNRVGA